MACGVIVVPIMFFAGIGLVLEGTGGDHSPIKCTPNITSIPSPTPDHLNGSWFVIARKGPKSGDYLPLEYNASLIRLTPEGDDLNMQEFHSIQSNCAPPLSGRWIKQNDGDGFLMKMKTSIGEDFEIEVRVIFHTLSGENNEEMNMVIYGCKEKISTDKRCPDDKELISILSNSRHPQTLALFQSAKHIEDSTCVDVTELRHLNTYSSCGDEIVDEDQKLTHAEINPLDASYVDVECHAKYWSSYVDIGEFFEKPRNLTVVAYIDPALDRQQIAHISCIFSSQTEAECEWIRQRKCFKSPLSQTLVGEHNKTRIESSINNFPPIDSSVATELNLTGNVIWQNKNEYVTVDCLEIEADDESCEKYRVYVWSDEDHMDQPTLLNIYRALHAYCIDPTEMIFLNTFHECTNETETDAVPGSVPPGWSPVSRNILNGSWYFAADLISKFPKIKMKSALVRLINNESDTSHLTFTYFGQKEDEEECIGPGTGNVRLLDNSVLNVSIDYTYRQIPNFQRTINYNTTIIYLDNQRMILYRCFKVAENGTCLQKDLDILMRSRYISPNDINILQFYLDRAGVSRQELRWFDMHSSCGRELGSSITVRRDMVTMAHKQVLDILTDVTAPRCKYRQLRGVRANLTTMEQAGVWYTTAAYDHLEHDTKALIFRVIKVSYNNGSSDRAVIRIIQSATLNNGPKHCHTMVFKMFGMEKFNAKNESDWVYEMHHETSMRQSWTMQMRFLFFNGHVGVLYSCIEWSEDGTCDKGGIYVISRHQSIDHTELAVLEMISRAVCMDPGLLYHTARHDLCVYDETKVKLPACATTTSIDTTLFAEAAVEDLFVTHYDTKRDEEWEKTLPTASPPLEEDPIKEYGLYYIIAAQEMIFPTMVLYRNGDEFGKITESESGCVYSNVSVRMNKTIKNGVALVDDQLVVLSRVARPANLDLLRVAAQRTVAMPCLNNVDYPLTSKCEHLVPPKCKVSEPLRDPSLLYDLWQLHASNPYMTNHTLCHVTQDHEDFLFRCNSESTTGACERTVITKIRIDAWGGYSRVTGDMDDFINKGTGGKEETMLVPVRAPFEIFERGNITVTDEYLLLTSEDDLMGLRYSLWINGDLKNVAQKEIKHRPLMRRDERALAEYCVHITKADLRKRMKCYCWEPTCK